MTPRRKPKRAVKGSIGHQLPLRLSTEMHAALQRAAKREGLSVAEWIRQALGSLLITGRGQGA